MSPRDPADQYRAAGVDLALAEGVKACIAELARETRTAASVGAVGAFAGLVRVPAEIARPLVVASTDGVGTKLLVAIRAGRHGTVGEDLVNHAVNDVLVHGARPLGFLDYFAAGRLDADVVAEVVRGVARACRAHGIPLLGGETAELPDLYGPGTYDLAGTIIGVVDEGEAIHGDRVVAGDVLVGLAASGFHTNGYTLLRRLIFDRLGLEVGDPFPGLDRSVAEVLLEVHRSYFSALWPVRGLVHGLAHVTGGGIGGNLARVLPVGVDAIVRPGAWPMPPAQRAVQRAGGISEGEMRRVFNLGIGMLVVVPPRDAGAVRAAAAAADVESWIVGAVQAGAGRVLWEPVESSSDE